MSIAVERPRIPASLPGIGWWGLAVGGALAGALVGWVVAFALVLFLVVQRVRPFDFLLAYLMVVAHASIINYSAGNLTFELSILTMVIVFAVGCYFWERRSLSFAIPDTTMTRALLFWVGLTLANAVRGYVIGHQGKFIGLDMVGPLGLLTSILVANRGLTNGERIGSLLWLWGIGLMHCAIGFWFFAVFHIRTGSIYFTPVPGLLASFFFAFALRSTNMAGTLLWILAIGPLLLHQFLSFTRGFWFALFGVFLFSLFLHGGRGPGARTRWMKGATIVGILTGLFIVGMVGLSVILGIDTLIDTAGTRLASSTSTKASLETASNIYRLIEYQKVLVFISEDPIIGKGVGFAYVMAHHDRIWTKWYSHNNYLYVAMKQGVVGLVIFMWMMIAAFKLALRGRKLEDPTQAAWCAGTAGAIVFILIYSLVHMPLADSNSTFVLAFLWGGTMAATKTGEWVFQWKRTPAAASKPVATP